RRLGESQVRVDTRDDDAGIDGEQLGADERDPHVGVDHHALVENDVDDFSESARRRPFQLAAPATRLIHHGHAITLRFSACASTSATRRFLVRLVLDGFLVFGGLVFEFLVLGLVLVLLLGGLVLVLVIGLVIGGLVLVLLLGGLVLELVIGGLVLVLLPRLVRDGPPVRLGLTVSGHHFPGAALAPAAPQ